MADPVGFEGANKVFLAPEGMENCGDLQVLQTENEIISCWRLTPEEIKYVIEHGIIWLSVSGQVTPPVCVVADHFVTVEGRPARAEPVLPQYLKINLNFLLTPSKAVANKMKTARS